QADERKKTEEGTQSFGRVAARELLRDPLRHAENISRVLIIIVHERIALELSVSVRAGLAVAVVQMPRDLLLHVEMQNVAGAPGDIMQLRAEAEKEIVRRFNPALVGFAQPVFSNQVRGRERAFLEMGHPKQVLIVAQCAAAAFD